MAAGTGLFVVIVCAAGGMIPGSAAIVNHEKINVTMVTVRAVVFDNRNPGECNHKRQQQNEKNNIAAGNFHNTKILKK